MRMSPVKIIEPRRHGDERGWFTETYNSATFAGIGISSTFLQDNHSLSTSRFTLRGLHFQLPPHGQDKLVRCIRGRIFDVAVDLRNGSSTYGNWVGCELSADNGRQLFIPVGFAHAFLTLEDNCEIVYKCSDLYSPDSDFGIRWDDPIIDIAWPMPSDTTPILSEKDASLTELDAFDSPFPYDGCPLAPLD